MNHINPRSTILVACLVLAPACSGSTNESEHDRHQKQSAPLVEQSLPRAHLEEEATPLTEEEANRLVEQLAVIESPFPVVAIELESPEIEAEHVYEAVFRYQFDHHPPSRYRKTRAFSLIIGRRDPSESFLQRFAAHRPPVIAASKTIWDQDTEFFIDDLEWKSPRCAVVTGGYHQDSYSTSLSHFT